ncbi:MAG: lipopolysaccharide kinase InaA family protein [Candidatus Binatia bacterium]
MRKKREALRQLALEIRRLHQRGFVHGDLIPSNILIRSNEKGVEFFYLDNDRTQRYPAWLPQRLWKRNLVQLNRFVLPGISLQDRMHFLRFYLGNKKWGERERRLARWLEKKTRRRRLECDRIEAPVSFRELMRWNGPYG